MLRRATVVLVALAACKPPPEVSCADATRKLDEVVYAGDLDPTTLESHARICAEEEWDANVRACLVRAATRDDLARCAPDTDATSPFLRGIVHGQ